MARPLKIKYVGSIAEGMQEINDSDLAYTTYQICQALADQTQGSGTQTVSLNNAGATGATVIGSFIDTYRPYPIGDHPVGTDIRSVTYTFYQALPSTQYTTTIRPVEWSSNGVREMTDASINSEIFAKVPTSLANESVGTYKMQPSAPAGGTWTSVITIRDEANGGTATTYVWRKLTGATPIVIRPLKLVEDGVREMTDPDIQSMMNAYATYVYNSGVGQYRVQSTTPTGGTWVRMGSQFSDTRTTVGDVTYTGYYSNQYATAFTGYYSSTYIAYYAGSRVKSYTRYYSGYAGLNYSSTFSANYTTGFAGSRTKYYTGYFGGSRTKNYVGATILSTKETISNISLWLRTS